MPISNLSQRQAFALLAEIDSTRNLLTYGVRTVRTTEFIETTRDPILTMLSIGVEKLYKVVIGLSSVERTGAWPPKSVMQFGKGHKIAEMHPEVLAVLRDGLDGGAAYPLGLLDDVQSDPVVPALIMALDQYGLSGRFYYLDLLADAPQGSGSPTAAWDDVENAAMADPVVNAALTAMSAGEVDQRLASAFTTALNTRVAQSVSRLWEAVAVSAIHGALGVSGVAFGHDLRQVREDRQ